MTFSDSLQFNTNTPTLIRSPFIILNAITFFLSFILLCTSCIILYYLNDYYLIKDLTLPLGSIILSGYMVLISIVGCIAIWKKKINVQISYMICLFILLICLVGISSRMIVESKHHNKIQHNIEKIWKKVGEYDHHSLHYAEGPIEKIEKHYSCCGWSKEIEGNHCAHFARRELNHGYCAPYISKSVQHIYKALGYFGIGLSIIEFVLLILSFFFLIKINRNIKSKSFILRD